MFKYSRKAFLTSGYVISNSCRIDAVASLSLSISAGEIGLPPATDDIRGISRSSLLISSWRVLQFAGDGTVQALYEAYKADPTDETKKALSTEYLTTYYPTVVRRK